METAITSYEEEFELITAGLVIGEGSILDEPVIAVGALGQTALAFQRAEVIEIEADPNAESPSTAAKQDVEPKDIMEADGKRRFLNKVSQIPLLSAEKELKLARLIERGDLDAKEQLITANILLVEDNVSKFMYQGFDSDDLLQEGILGLIRAAEKFDYRKGYRFSTYATIWIMQAMARGLADKGRMISLPVAVVEKLRSIKKTEKRLTQSLGRSPTDAEIADASAKLSEKKIRDYKKQDAIEPSSLNKPIGEDESTEFGELLPTDEDIEHRVATKLIGIESLRRLRGSMTEQEFRVLTDFHGVNLTATKKTIAQIGKELDLSLEQVRRVRVLAEKKGKTELIKNPFND